MMGDRGQSYHIRTDAILDATSEIISDRGLTASLDLIAKRARVSKQTIYNYYGGRYGLISALVRRWLNQLAEALNIARSDSAESALAAFAEKLMDIQLTPASIAIVKDAIQVGPRAGENILAKIKCDIAVHLVNFLEEETASGRLSVDDTAEAAELFVGMTSVRQLSALFGDEAHVDTRRSIARAPILPIASFVHTRPRQR
jgi:TetR/AcrR family transcriptional repressor of mexJK operon